MLDVYYRQFVCLSDPDVLDFFFCLNLSIELVEYNLINWVNDVQRYENKIHVVITWNNSLTLFL